MLSEIAACPAPIRGTEQCIMLVMTNTEHRITRSRCQALNGVS